MLIAFLISLEIAQAAKPPASLGGELVKIIITAVLASLFGAVGAYIAAKFKLQELDQNFILKIRELTESFELKVKELKTQFELQREADRNKEETKLRDKYLSPLLFAPNE